MTIRVCLAGATGWVGSAVAIATAALEDITLVSAVSRTHAGRTLGEALTKPGLTCPVFSTAREALAATPCDVFFDFTKADVAKSNVVTAIEHGAHVVIGTSGLTNEDYEEIASAAEKAQCGVLAVGNFALTVVLMQKFAEIAAKFIPHWEIIDYAHDDKKDAPSGTARELAYRLSKIRASELTVPLDQVQGMVEGARREHDRLTSSFRSFARIQHLCRGHLRHARPKADHSSRLRFQCPTLCRGIFAGDSQSQHVCRSAPRAG